MASSSGNDDDLTIPRAAINKMIKETLPNVRVANDARELVVNCCTEFIHLISSEANEICNKSEKKTISPEHVIQGEPRRQPGSGALLAPRSSLLCGFLHCEGRLSVCLVSGERAWHQPLFSDSEESAILWEKSLPS